VELGQFHPGSVEAPGEVAAASLAFAVTGRTLRLGQIVLA
jgi:hypothetical protein